MVSADLAFNGLVNSDNSVHYSFGQPRVGDFDWAALHDVLLPNYYRVTHKQDFISDQFNPILDYVHHGIQVWYNNEMTPGSPYITCKLDADPKCFGPPRISMQDHRVYFGVNIPKYGEAGCPTPIV
jgi:hypothetical protein